MIFNNSNFGTPYKNHDKKHSSLSSTDDDKIYLKGFEGEVLKIQYENLHGSRNQLTKKLTSQSHIELQRKPTRSRQCIYDDVDRDMFLMDKYPSYRKFLDAESAVLEFGGNFGSLTLMILMPIFIFYNLLCNTTKCSVSMYDLKELLQIDKIILGIKIICQLFYLQLIIHGSGMFGSSHKNKHDSQIVCCFNGIFAVVITFAILLLLDYLGFLLISDIMDAYVGIATMSYIAAIILTAFLHCKCHKNVKVNLLNNYAESSKKIYNFWRGKEILPCVANINIRMLMNRYTIVATMILLLIHAKSAISWNTPEEVRENMMEILDGICIQPTVVVIAIMQMCYIGYHIVYEKDIVYSFEWNYEGVGYMEVVKCCMYPFYFTSVTKYAADNDVVFWKPVLVSLFAIYVLGFCFKMWYRSPKPDLRINPLHPDHNDSVVSDYVSDPQWYVSIPRKVRHPSHVGDFVIQMSFALAGLFMLSLAMFPPVVTAACIAHRAWRIDRKCLVKYRTAWKLYCVKHPNIMFPGRW